MSNIPVPMEGFGGGGASLNFKVVGNPQPANPNENTIWLNTNVKITGRYFQAEQPAEMAEGEVWISTGTTSQVAFNALKKGTIMVYPLAAKQMQGGTLVDVTAKSYQDGEWADWWDGCLYKTGDQYVSFTGGWQARAAHYTHTGYIPTTPTLRFDSDSMFAGVYSSLASGVIECKNDIDLSGYNTLTVVFPSVTWISNYSFIEIWVGKRENISSAVASTPAVKASVRSAGTYTVDISSLSGDYDICVHLSTTEGSKNTTFSITEVMLT